MVRAADLFKELLTGLDGSKSETPGGITQNPIPAPPARQFPNEYDFDERQFITIVDDADIFEAAQNVEENPWLAPVLTGLALTAARISPVGLAVTSGLVIAQAVSNYRKSGKDDGDMIVLPVLKSDAKNLVLPISHPRKKTIYVAHPGSAEIYYPLSDFHVNTFEHKFLELMKILRFLGAKSIVATYSEQSGTLLTAHGGLTGKSLAVTGDAKLGATSNSNNSIYWAADYPNISNKPILPANLIWYPSELAWHEVAEARLQFNVEKFALKLTYDNDFGVTANVAAKLANAGLKMGGEFKGFSKTSLDVAVDFWN